MTCNYSDYEVALFVEGDLPTANACDIQTHLVSCAVCRDLAASLRESQLILKGLRQHTVNPAALASVRARVIEEISSIRFHWPWARWAYAMAGAVFVVVIGVIFALRFPNPEPVRQIVKSDNPIVAAEGESETAAQSVITETSPSVPVAQPRLPRRPEPERDAQVVSAPAESQKPLVVKLLTDDPNVVIYWLIDQNDGGTL